MGFVWKYFERLLFVLLVAYGTVTCGHAQTTDDIDTSSSQTTGSTDDSTMGTMGFQIIFSNEPTDDGMTSKPTESTGQDFGYTGTNGPDNWHKEYSTCVGKLQSPIDLQKETATPITFPPLKLSHYDEVPSAMQIINNGHTVEVHLTPSGEIPSVESGPLNGSYNFAQFHFHWGANDSVGSEDTIDNKRYPMEMHIVHYKAEYGSMKEAMQNEDGLMVLAVFFEVNDTTCRPLSEIAHALVSAAPNGSSVELTEPFALMALLPENIETYFTYHGSLTTPPCFEVVTWIDFTEPQLITEDELEQFRHVHTETGILLNNFRPLQSVGNRTVFYNSNDKST